MSKTEYLWGTGRRKTSVARVRIKDGNGTITVNKKPMTEYFTVAAQREAVLAPLQLTNTLDKYDVFVNVNGGGGTGQAGAVLLGLSRALCKVDESFEEKFRSHGYMTRDGRMKERKKYGRRKARASFQFSKR